MKRIDIKAGFSCNNNCMFCVQGHRKGGEFTKSTTEIREILESCAQEYQGVVFTGGEVTIREDFLEIVSCAKQLGYSVIHIQSNGRLFSYKPFCKEAIDAGANEFGLALHGHSADLHDYLTKDAGSFSQTVKGIRNLTEMGQKVITNTVVTKPNYRHLESIANLLCALGAVQYQFAFIHIMGNARKHISSVVPRISMVRPYLHRGLDVGIRKGVRVMTEAIPFCFMIGYEHYLAERIIPETRIFDADNVIANFTVVRQNEGKAKGPNCPECRFFSECEGPWREYPEIFGWDEFVPVKH